jgi:hypothetical protein
MMNNASWVDAFLIFKMWQDKGALVAVFRPDTRFPQIQGATVISGGTGFIVGMDSAAGQIRVGQDPGCCDEVDLLGATFRYSDSRDSPLLDGSWECSLEATLPDGSLIVFAEEPELPPDRVVDPMGNSPAH